MRSWAACISAASTSGSSRRPSQALRGFDLDVIAAGHCTGWRAMAALANEFGDSKLVPLAVGKRLRF